MKEMIREKWQKAEALKDDSDCVNEDGSVDKNSVVI